MKLLAVLLLCTQVFSSSGSQLPIQDASCNDPNIFEAVDLALRKYNAGRKEGNQFALNRITEAGISSAGVGDDQYHVRYEVRESTCAVQDGHGWQDCQFRPIVDAATGSCKAHVYIKKAEKISNVISQDCNITPAEGPVQYERYLCLGCAHPIPHNSAELQPIVDHGINKFNKEENQEYLFKFGEVKKATRQVVSGWNYDIDYTIVETNCSKDAFEDVNEDCHPYHFVGTCHAEVYVIINGSIAVFNQKCTISQSSARACLGCPELIPTNSTSLVDPLRHAINKFNSENNLQLFYEVEHVDRATQQVVAGMKFEVSFRIRTTNCSKAENEHLHDGCNFLEDMNGGEERKCRATIVVVPWEKKVDVKSLACSMPHRTMALYAYIPGLSPFRSVDSENIKENDSESDRKGHSDGHEHSQIHEHGCEHSQGKEHKQGKKTCKHGDHQESSEESHEQHSQKVTPTLEPGMMNLLKPTTEAAEEKMMALPTVHHPIEASTVGVVAAGADTVISILPLEPEMSGLLPNLPGDLLPDLPEAPARVCPGELWKPKTLSQPTSPIENS